MQQPPIYLDINNNKSIINALKAGEEYVFDAVYRYYFRRLCAFCSQYVSEQEEIEEIVQDTMMWLWENRCSLMEELTLKTHFEIRRKVHQEITEKFEKEFDNPDFYLENELFRLYENALKQLPKDYREAYEMNRNHRMTHKEIAEKLNVSPQTVNYRIGQALKLLRIALKDYLPLFILYFGLDIFKQS